MNALQDSVDCTFFRALAEPRRIDILSVLFTLGGTANVGQIAERVDVDASVVSRHLRELAAVGITTVEKRGRERWHRIDVEACSAQLARFQGFLDAARAGVPCC